MTSTEFTALLPLLGVAGTSIVLMSAIAIRRDRRWTISITLVGLAVSLGLRLRRPAGRSTRRDPAAGHRRLRPLLLRAADLGHGRGRAAGLRVSRPAEHGLRRVLPPAALGDPGRLCARGEHPLRLALPRARDPLGLALRLVAYLRRSELPRGRGQVPHPRRGLIGVHALRDGAGLRPDRDPWPSRISRISSSPDTRISPRSRWPVWR